MFLDQSSLETNAGFLFEEIPAAVVVKKRIRTAEPLLWQCCVIRLCFQIEFRLLLRLRQWSRGSWRGGNMCLLLCVVDFQTIKEIPKFYCKTFGIRFEEFL
ncbi:hypothetical protein RHGRI_004214 [Rhododendron griersonianum]|uniref:Uncharacterized protein n=1 Tax=Rhododendron griersonianum TaxID=479676 RepID=A0AAV6L847_9ERIC|nr:hypothetical protein RHGRI_004214 [Rhododendron griersonianum]